MRTWIAALAMALCATPALADITAVYEGGGVKMTVEIASDGDVRTDVTAKPGEYILLKGSEAFVVLPTPSGVVVDCVSDVAAVMRELMEKMHPGYQAQMAAALKAGGSVRLELLAGDEVTVRGRAGTPYFMKEFAGPGQQPIVVIAHDPALEPLRIAVLRSTDISSSMLSTMVGAANPMADAMRDVLKMGAPLQFGSAELTSVSDAPIPASHFDLPGSPETREQIRKRIEASATKSGPIVGF